MDLHNYECFSRYTFVSDKTHKNLTWLDHRIWRGSILNPNRSYDGHLSWTQVLAEHIGVHGSIETLGNWNNPPRGVYCVGNNHYNHKDVELGHSMTVSLQRVRYRGMDTDRAIWTCKFRLGGEDVVTILRTVGSGERFEFWGPSGYVSGLGLARERIIRLAHPYLPIAKRSGHPTVVRDANKLSMSAIAKTYSEQQPSALTSSTIGASSASNLGARPSYLNPIVPVAPMQRQSVVIDLCDSSSDDEDEDLPPAASRSSPLSSAATFEDTDLTIPDLAAGSDPNARNEDESATTALVKRAPTSCPYCDFEGRAYKSLSVANYDVARHIETAEKLRAIGRMPQRRDLCRMSLCTPSAFGKHRCIPSTIEPSTTEVLNCQHCSYRTVNRVKLEKHQAAAENLRESNHFPERCETCAKTFCTGKDFAFHECDAEEVIVGGHNSAAKSDDLQQNRELDWMERDAAGNFHCPSCDYFSNFRPNVVRHLDCGQGREKQECGNCNQCFCTPTALYRHPCAVARSKRSTGHRPMQQLAQSGPDIDDSESGEDLCERDDDGNYCCPHCDYSSPWSTHVRRHMIGAANTGRAGQREVHCNDCGKVYCTASALSYHKCGDGQDAALEANASSAVVGSNSTVDSSFERDTRGYYGCPDCDFTGRWVSIVQRHWDKARVSGMPMLSCEDCGKIYCNQRALTCHDCGDEGPKGTSRVLELEEAQDESDLGPSTRQGNYGCHYCDFSVNDHDFASRHQELAQKLF